MIYKKEKKINKKVNIFINVLTDDKMKTVYIKTWILENFYTNFSFSRI